MPSIISGIGQALRHAFSRPQPPQQLLDLQRAQEAAHSAPTDPNERDKRWTGKFFFRAGAIDFVRNKYAAMRDAGRAIPVAENADLWILRYAYTTHKSQEAWIQNPPRDGKLKIRVVTTPSTHAGSTPKQKRENFERFARENEYIAEVRFPDGTTQRHEFKVENPPEYSSVSPAFEIDLKKHKGDIIVRGWAKGSAGVYGYQEARETIIHNT